MTSTVIFLTPTGTVHDVAVVIDLRIEWTDRGAPHSFLVFHHRLRAWQEISRDLRIGRARRVQAEGDHAVRFDLVRLDLGRLRTATAWTGALRKGE